MKTRKWSLCGAIVAFLMLAVGASGLPTLIFIDDFESDNIRKSTPLQGEGGGVIGGDDANFWTVWHDTYVTASAVPTNGYLRMDIFNATTNTGLVYLRSGAYSEFDYKSTAAGEGLLMSVRGFSMDWDEGKGVFLVGFATGGSWYASSNAVYFRISPTDGVLGFLAKEAANTSAPTLQSFTPAGPERPTGMDLYIDSVSYSVTVYYDDDSTRQGAGDHGLDPETASNMRLMFQVLPGQSNHQAFALVDGITVTQIPEPAGLAMMLGAVASALLARRARRR